MKKKLLFLLLVLCIGLGLSLLLYAPLLKLWNTHQQQAAISHYTQLVDAMSEEAYEQLWSQAAGYNSGLKAGSAGMEEWSTRLYSAASLAEYQSLLDVDGGGMMGYIEIPKLNCTLPIYHGSGADILAKGVGHIEYSSLPVGGAGTHTALIAHRAETGANYFKDLDKLTEGDTFTLYILNQALTYQVDQLLTVLPEEIDALEITEGEDYCTLITCTPYGSNACRLLVRGHRAEGGA